MGFARVLQWRYYPRFAGILLGSLRSRKGATWPLRGCGHTDRGAEVESFEGTLPMVVAYAIDYKVRFPFGVGARRITVDIEYAGWVASADARAPGAR